MYQYPGYGQYPQWYPPYAGGNPYGYGYASPRQKKRRKYHTRLCPQTRLMGILSWNTGSPSPADDVQVHQLLGGQHRGTAYWDVTQDPESSARQLTGRGVLEPIPDTMLAAPATDPPTPYMKIICDDFPFDITLDVGRGEAISVGMVLGAIFGTLQEPLTRDEWDEETKSGKKRIHKSRCIRLGKTPATFKMDGHVLKIDLLTDKTFFVSLKPVGPPDRPDHWLLKLGLPPKRQ